MPHDEQYLLEHNQVTMLQEPDYISVRTYAKQIGVHYNTVLIWISAGRIPFSARTHGKYTRYYIPADAVPPLMRPGRVRPDGKDG